MEEIIKKKRGRKPKNFLEQVEQPNFEKKKRGRKKKYEIENFQKIKDRDLLNNFNHYVAYSDDEEPDKTQDSKKIAFGNLDITVTKKINVPDTFRSDLRNTFKKESSRIINENEYSSDEEKEIPICEIINEINEKQVKTYTEPKKYVTDFSEKIKEQSLKQLRVVTCHKNIISDSEWPESTNIHCWWCCHSFECSPCTLPTNYDPRRFRFTFTGIFCSWNCVKAYNIDRSDHKKHERAGLITLLIQKMYGVVSSVNLKASPPRQTLKMFGGYLDIDEFRDKSSTVDSYHMNLNNYNYIHPEITEITNLKVKKEKKNLRLSRN